jgi:hypothetical protein
MLTPAIAQGSDAGLSEGLAPDVDATNAYAQSDPVSSIKQALELSAEQEKLWGPVEEALNNIQQQRSALRSAPTAGGPTNPIERLRQRAEFDSQQADALKKLADAVQPLWATLSNEQKRELMPSFAMAPSRTDQNRQMGDRRRDDDVGMHHHRYHRGAGRYDDRDRADRNRRDSDDGDWRYHRRDRMMGRRGGDERDEQDDMRRDRSDRYSRWRSEDDYRPRPGDFDRDRRDYDRRSDRGGCRCYRED